MMCKRGRESRLSNELSYAWSGPKTYFDRPVVKRGSLSQSCTGSHHDQKIQFLRLDLPQLESNLALRADRKLSDFAWVVERSQSASSSVNIAEKPLKVHGAKSRMTNAQIEPRIPKAGILKDQKVIGLRFNSQKALASNQILFTKNYKLKVKGSVSFFPQNTARTVKLNECILVGKRKYSERFWETLVEVIKSWELLVSSLAYANDTSWLNHFIMTQSHLTILSIKFRG